jgi:DNA polymerase III subunit epsilon
MNERQQRICAWARSYLQHPFCVLDTETNGLDSHRDEVIEIAIVSEASGKALLSSLIQTRNPNRQALATDVHGISREMLVHAPTFPQLWPTIEGILSQHADVLVYNARYDKRLLAATAQRYGYRLPAGSWSCLMEQYAEYFGDWNDYRQSYTWQKLAVASMRLGVQVDGNYHRATADALCTLGILRALAARYQPQQESGAH